MEERTNIYEKWINWYAAQPNLNIEYANRRTKIYVLFSHQLEALKAMWNDLKEVTENEAVDTLEATKKAYLLCLKEMGIKIKIER